MGALIVKFIVKYSVNSRFCFEPDPLNIHNPRSAVSGVSPGRGLLAPHGYLHLGKRQASGVKSPATIASASLWFFFHPVWVVILIS